MSRALVAGAVLGAGLICGGILIQSGAWREADAATASSRLLEQVVGRLRRDYLDSLSIDELYRRAALGLVREIEDPHSEVLTPERYRQILEGTTGRYPGIGVELDLRGGYVTVIAPLAGTPADSAGIEPGDRIIAIDGQPTRKLGIEEVQQALRGPRGAPVRLDIERADGASKSFTLRRAVIEFHPVQRATMVAAGIGYVELATFSETAEGELTTAVNSLRKAGARSLILDLRENPGGLLEQGIAVADLFLDAGQVIASTRGRTVDADHDFRDETAQLWPEFPVVALVDSGSASAAEIVAGALQDHGRAVLVGSPTYGKGSAQSVFPLSGGRALKLTTARWFTPDGRSIERDSLSGGISPDVIVRMENRGLKIGATAPSSILRPASSNSRDPALSEAIRLLNGVTTVGQLRQRLPGK